MGNRVIFADISENNRRKLISRLVDELPVLRIKLGLSQDELSNMVGISRQTYSAVETKRRDMSWSVYLALLLIFDCNEQTHQVIREMGFLDSVPDRSFADESDSHFLSSFVRAEDGDIRKHLDDQAIHAIETVVMVEYARCNNIPGEAVVKAFDGRNVRKIRENDAEVQKLIHNIRTRTATDKKDG